MIVMSDNTQQTDTQQPSHNNRGIMLHLATGKGKGMAADPQFACYKVCACSVPWKLTDIYKQTSNHS
jgi:hypothetical protein